MPALDTSQGQGVTAPIYKHGSSTVKAVPDAGGEVDRSQYTGKTPKSEDRP